MLGYTSVQRLLQKGPCMIRLLFLIVLIWPILAAADVYTCPDGKGSVILQSAPCPGSTAPTQPPPMRHAAPPVAPAPAPVPTPSPSTPQRYLTRGWGFACRFPWWYEEMATALSAKDTRAERYMIESHRCVRPRANIEATPLERIPSDPSIPIHVRLYVPDSEQAVEVWMNSGNLMSLPR